MLDFNTLALALSILIFLLLYLGKSINRLGTVFAAISPFDGIFTAFLGVAGNLITFILLIPFFIHHKTKKIYNILFGTKIQKIIALYILAGIPSHIPLIIDNPIIGFSLLAQKFALLFFIGILAYTIEKKKSFKIYKVLAVSMTIFIFLSVFELYSGISILPKTTVNYSSDLHTKEGLEARQISTLRLKGLGNTVSTNRLAVWLQVPLFFAIGWFYSRRKIKTGILPLTCALIILFGLITTISRSGQIGFFIETGCKKMVVVVRQGNEKRKANNKADREDRNDHPFGSMIKKQNRGAANPE